MPPYSQAHLAAIYRTAITRFRGGHALARRVFSCGTSEPSPNALPPSLGFLYSCCPAADSDATTRSITVTMEFESDILGEFSESFRFALRGNEEPVPCQFKGHVVSFRFSNVAFAPHLRLLQGEDQFVHPRENDRPARDASGRW